MSSSKDGDKDPSRKAKVPKRVDLHNGGSLEDCLSNVYSLLELPGIKWKCFRTKNNAPRGNPLISDLVLKSYSKCVQDGILCAWRRKQLEATGNSDMLPLPHFSNDTHKELWVFWYEEEPERLKQHTEGLDCDMEMSSEAQMNIVSYEVRTILFKALHVVLERDLTKDGYVRFGRWFTTPTDARDHYLHYTYSAYTPALRLNFFVHGAHTICASVQAQRQPTLLVLARRHLEYKGQKSFAVIVGPWSMRGVLVQDQMALLNDPEMQKRSEEEWNHWKEYLQMEEKEPEKVPEEKTKSPEPEFTQPTPHRSLLADSSDEEVVEKCEVVDDEVPENIPAAHRWMYEPDISYQPEKVETPEEREQRLEARERRKKRRKEREERRKEIERQRADVANPEEYDSDVVTDPETEEPEPTVNNEVPKMVLLEIDGVRMLYPSKFICVTLEADRQVLESMGLRTNAVIDELVAQGRRPRNRFVVNAGNPMLNTLAVYQYCQKERVCNDVTLDRTKAPFGEEPLPPIKRNFVEWKYKKNHRYRRVSGTRCIFYRYFWRRLRGGVTCNDTKTIYNKMLDRVHRRNQFNAYHKKKVKVRKAKYKRPKGYKTPPSPSPEPPPKKINFIPSKKRARSMAIAEKAYKERVRRKQRLAYIIFWNSRRGKAIKARQNNRVARDLTRPSGLMRGESEDETCQVDELCQEDWTNFDDEHPKGIDDIDVPLETEFYNDVVIPEAPPDESYKPAPFLPITFINRKPENCDFNYTPGEEMTDEQFDAIYKDIGGKWTPDMSRAEKISLAQYTFDPLSIQPGSPRPYHLQKEQSKRKNKWEAVIPMPKNNKYYKGKKCKRGLKGVNEFWAEKHRKFDEKKKLYLAKWRKHIYNHEMRVAKWCQRELEKQMSTRSLEKALQNLKLIVKKDTRSDGTKQQKFSKLTPKEKEVERAKASGNVVKPKLLDVLDQLDMNSYCSKYEKAGPIGCGATDGYIVPDYSESPHGAFDEESDQESEEHRNGLGEGTSDQFSDGEEVEPEVIQIDDDDTPLVAEVVSNIGHVRTALEHIGPDGLLSPPASNEMPKGGPLSVGPPSVESQGLNQIYPTPPSVQMLQGDTAQAYSPYGGKLKSMMNVVEEDVERISVPGGVATIVEIEADDPETENVKAWNKTTQSKLSKFLASSCIDPIFSARKIKCSTPMTDKFKIEEVPEPATSKLVYKPMVTRNFESAPPRAFAALVRSRIHERRAAALSMPSTSAGIPAGVLQSPMPPMFQSPPMSMPMAPSSVGPMGQNPMGTPGYPGTPGPFTPTTPTYPMGPPRPGSNFGPTPGGYPPHMMGPGYHAQMRGPGFISPQNSMHQHQQQMQMMRMQQMMQNRQMAGQGMPPGYGGPGMPQNYGPPGTPGYGVPPNGPSSVQQLNNFVNQSRFGPNSVPHPGQPPPYGMPPMIPQSPGYNQPFGGNSMMSPMQQHQFHQQQMHQQQMQHQMQLQRNQMQQQHQQQLMNPMQSLQHPQQSALQPNPAQQILEQQQQIRIAFQNLTNKQKAKFNARQVALSNGLRPKSLQPTALRNLKNPPDANMPIKQHMMQPFKPPAMDVPQGDSLTIAIILSDTILDLHFDVVFDSCPICSCSASIRSRDLGMYITPHEVLRTGAAGHSNMREHTVGAWSGFNVNSATTCTCGFSAIRHRYLSCSTGLFPEDANEATTLDNAVAAVAPPLDWQKRYGHRDMVWFDSKSVHDMALLDQIRQMSYSNSIGKAVAQMAATREHKRNLLAGDIEMDINVPSEYIISYVDTLELLMLGNSAIEMSIKSSNVSRNQTATAQKFLAYFHPWGLQTANEMVELNTSEWIDVLAQVTPTLEGAMKATRNVSAEASSSTPSTAIEGPMTWKQIVTKSIKGRTTSEEDEDYWLAEPIPAVMRATEKEAIRSAPHIDQYYDQASLGPIDQPKDVMYLTIIPDNDVIYQKTVKFMDKVTETYEKMRLGRHIPFPASTATATRLRGLILKHEDLQKDDPPYPDKTQQIVTCALNEHRNMGQKAAPPPPPVNTNPEKWSRELKRKLAIQEALDKGPTEEFNPEYEGDQEQWERTTNFRRLYPKFSQNRVLGPQREGILRVGTPMVPSRQASKHTAVGTQEFTNMTRHLSDSKGFVSRLKNYLHQMEDLVTHCLIESPAAFERHGYRYQMAVEGRLKRKDQRRNKEEERLRYEAAKAEDERRLANGAQKPNEENDLFLGTQVGNLGPENWIDEDVEERNRKKQKEEEKYPTEGPQAPSPVPAGMVHIPETLSEQEQTVQPSLAQLLTDPIMPTNAAAISWTKRDTSLFNPFVMSNQPPIAFEAAGSADTDAAATLPHVIVIYIVNPFQYGPEGHTALHMRIAILAFIRVFNSIVGRLPYVKRPQLQMEIVGMESMELVTKPYPDYFNNPKVPFDLLYEETSRTNRPSETAQVEVIRALSVAVYTHPRVFLPDICKTMSARCMTAFGPGSQLINTIQEMEKINMDSFLRSNKRAKFDISSYRNHHHHPLMNPMNAPQMEKKNYTAYRIPSNIVCLAPPPAVSQMEKDGKSHLNPLDEQTLFVSYCLVGADFLVATATDAQGKLIDNCIANLKPRKHKNQLYRLKYKTQILDGMGKLWSFILGVMASEIKNWRLVVGRLGRIGHGEFRAWTHLLNKTSLLRYSGSLKDICATCRSMPTIAGTPAIISACLITLEPEPSIRLMPDFFDLEACAKKTTNFQTPEDLSSTHILTFPVGAEINLEAQDQTADTKAEENWEFGDLDIMEGLEDGDTELMKDLGLETPSSAAIRQPGASSMFFSEDSSTIEIQNQPLSSGYYISTAPAPELPNWFWATCPSAKRHSPVHLKSSLHINITEVKNDDIAMESTKEKDKDKDKEEKDIHPLESRQTEEVLRHVLESYNALSWLNLNRETGERYSCLPIHIQHLLRLYHSVARLIT